MRRVRLWFVLFGVLFLPGFLVSHSPALAQDSETVDQQEPIETPDVIVSATKTAITCQAGDKCRGSHHR